MSGEEQKVFSVAALNRQVKTALERNYNGVWLEAEVVKAKTYSSGHLYFELCDPGGKAQINGVMWRGTAMRYGGFVKPGKTIRLQGKVTVYEVAGRYQFVAEKVVESGEGLKAKALEELKKRLHKEGLFDDDKKRPLPLFPSCVGVVTSRQGAALQDIIKVAGRRFPTQILLVHATVQGASASKEIIKAIEFLGLQKKVDVMIVGRGGGGSDDLDAFNDEGVVRAVANSPVPVICAVGHQVDTTLAELASDKRAATPSEAAEYAVPDIDGVMLSLSNLKRRLYGKIKLQMAESRQSHSLLQGHLGAMDPRVRLGQQREKLSGLLQFLNRWPHDALGRVRIRLQRTDTGLKMWAGTAVSGHKSNLVSAAHGIYSWPEPAMAKLKGELGQAVAGLNALSPLASLGRGYSIVKNSSGKIIKNSNDVRVGGQVNIKLSKGELGATITNITDVVQTGESK